MPVAGNKDILNGHFFAVNRDSNAFVKPQAHDIKYIMENNRPFLQVVGVVDPVEEQEQVEIPDLNEQDKKDLANLEQGKELDPVKEEELPKVELSDEDREKIDKEFDESVQDVFSEFIESGFYGEPALIEIDSGWIVHYWPSSDEYPPAMCISAGNEIVPSGIDSPEHAKFGTTVGQAFDAAAQVVLLALVKKWKSLHIVSGTDMMQWAAWAVAEKNGLECIGYDATGEDRAKAERVAEIIESKYSHRPAVAMTPNLTPGTTTPKSHDKDHDDKDK